MKTLLNAFRRFGIGPVERWFMDSFRLITDALVPVCLIGFALAAWLGSSKLAITTGIACDVIVFLFGARLTLTYALMRPFIKRMFGKDISTVGNVWYWKAFIAMWVTLPHYALAILQPWRHGFTGWFMLTLFMVLHVVATQREFTGFYRKLYTVIAFGAMFVLIFACAFPETFWRMGTGHRIGQNNDKVQNTLENNASDRINKQLAEVGGEVDALDNERVDAIRLNTSWDHQDQLDRLEKLQAELVAKHNALVMSAESSIIPGWMKNVSLGPLNPNNWDEGAQASAILGMVAFGAVLTFKNREKKKVGAH